jgi:hypothetical protein
MKIDLGRRTMARIQKAKHLLFLCFLVAGVLVLVVPASADEQGGDMQQRPTGQEVTRAPGAGDDTVKEKADTAQNKAKPTGGHVWEKTKKESKALVLTIGQKTKKVWAKTKAKSKETWREGKAKIHEATAPKPTDTSAKPATPPPAVESAKPATSVPVQL